VDRRILGAYVVGRLEAVHLEAVVRVERSPMELVPVQLEAALADGHRGDAKSSVARSLGRDHAYDRADRRGLGFARFVELLQLVGVGSRRLSVSVAAASAPARRSR
jgi:hypothetical protein